MTSGLTENLWALLESPWHVATHSLLYFSVYLVGLRFMFMLVVLHGIENLGSKVSY